MSPSLYVTAIEPHSGKSVVALGLMEILSTRVQRVGFYRPIVASSSQADPQIELIRRRYRLETDYDEMHGLSDEEGQAAIASGIFDQVEKRVVSTFRALDQRCDVVVCEGTDFAGSTPALDFDLNAGLASLLDTPVLVVVTGDETREIVKSARVAHQSLERKGCTLFGVIANRVTPALVDEVAAALAARFGERPVYVLPEQPELARLTMDDVAAAVGARTDGGAADGLHREVRDVVVAAMSVEHFIEGLVEGALVIVSGDRPDIVMTSVAATASAELPAVAGIVLTGGYEIAPALRRLAEDAPFPVLEASGDTYHVANAVNSLRPVLAPDNERRIATALGLFQSRVDASEIERHIALERPARMTPLMFEYELIERAKESRQHIVLPEGNDERVLRAAEILQRRGVVELTLLGRAAEVRTRSAALGLDLADAVVIDPLDSPLRTEYAHAYYELRRHKGITEEAAFDMLGDVSYFGTMMVHRQAVDGMVSGAAHTTGDTIRPALEIVRAVEGVSVVSSVFLMCLADRVVVYGDCAVNPQPTVEQLADIAISSAATAETFGVEPRVAMLSYSTGDSGRGERVEAVRLATELVRERRPDLKVDGPIQYDAAVDAAVAKLKLPASEVAGRATVFIFPDLDTGNIAYKAVQRSANAVAIGPVLQGLRRPVNDLSRGCTVADVVNTVAITAIQAHYAEAG
ncbi:MAG: phosphate acetyltransferase [Thermoleophilaceae bacterium]|nr:phosphate acetyltransferase [Thermoleophilaceae bacterium]